jgi:hypothetical protein
MPASTRWPADLGIAVYVDRELTGAGRDPELGLPCFAAAVAPGK